jgi:sn-glycerol 3-phosphate transport system substrate-binding protein
MNRRNAWKLAAAGLSLLALGTAPALAQTKVDFYYPVQVGGPVSKVIDGYVAKFEAANPDIDVAPVYAGNYNDTTTKALTAAKAGTPPAVAVLLATDIFTLYDEDVIEPFDDFIKTDEDKAWAGGFMPAYLKSAQMEGQLWSVPFQRSTAVMYYNKQAFKDAGLDPEKYPTTWDEMAAARQSGDRQGCLRHGDPLGRRYSRQCRFGPMAVWRAGRRERRQAGERRRHRDLPHRPEGRAGTAILGRSLEGRHPPSGYLRMGHGAGRFPCWARRHDLAHPTGNLANIRKNATFDFGVAPFPGNPKPASVLGGGNLYIFKEASDEQKAAAFKLVKFLTSDEVLADWSLQTGYVAPRDGSWQTAEMKKYVEEVPQAAVALKQIPDSVPEFSTHENARTTKVLNDALAAALTGGKTAEQALSDAQAEIDTILKPYR